MFIKNKYLIAFLILVVFSSPISSQNTPEHDLIASVERIWDRATHNAFSSLIEFNDKLYCAFRESEGHVSDINGSIRVIVSDDEQNWRSVAHIFERGVDLRDPQLSVTADNRIMLNMGGSIYINGRLEAMQPRVSFSDTDGINFSVPQQILIDDKVKSDKDWLWKATWHQGKSYATIYQPIKKESLVHLLVSKDGINYKFITTLDVHGGNETTLRFTPDNRMIAVVRRGENGYIGYSDLPYTIWQWNELESRLGGPDLVILENGVMLCGTREYAPGNKRKTIIARVELDGKFIKLLTLPSGGDCSYPGFLMKNNILHVSYYSSHEEKTAIYLARILDLKYGYDSFKRVSEPLIASDQNGKIELSCEDDQARILYTLDGSIPTAQNGYTYDKPVTITRTTLLRALAVRYRYPASKTISQNVGTDIFQKAQTVERKLDAGLKFEYYESQLNSTAEITNLPIINSGVASSVTTSHKKRDTDYAFIYTGYIKIPKDDTYTFYLTSNDGSRFYLNDELAINNDGPHGNKEESTVLSLTEGYHKISLSYFQQGGGQKLILEWNGNNSGREEIPGSVYYH